jgi:DNA polymerase-3 subunit gamma/tau
MRNAAALAERQKAAEQLIQSDPLVQNMIQEFGAKIVPGSIKLISSL